MKHTWLIILFALLTLQSTNAVLERHHIESNTDKHLVANSTNSAKHEPSHHPLSEHDNGPVSSHDTEVDCNHCCHCHKVKPFSGSPIRPHAMPLAFQNQFIDQDEFVQSQTITGLYRPPKLVS